MIFTSILSKEMSTMISNKSKNHIIHKKTNPLNRQHLGGGLSQKTLVWGIAKHRNQETHFWIL